MVAIVTMIAGVGGVNFPTAVVITTMKGMDTMKMLCKDFIKAQGRQRSTAEGHRERATTAKDTDARPVLPLAMATPGSRQMLH